MADKVLPSEGAQNMDTSGYHVSDLEDNEFHWEDPDLIMDSVFDQLWTLPLHLQPSTILRWVR